MKRPPPRHSGRSPRINVTRPPPTPRGRLTAGRGLAPAGAVRRAPSRRRGVQTPPGRGLPRGRAGPAPVVEPRAGRDGATGEDEDRGGSGCRSVPRGRPRPRTGSPPIRLARRARGRGRRRALPARGPRLGRARRPAGADGVPRRAAGGRHARGAQARPARPARSARRRTSSASWGSGAGAARPSARSPSAWTPPRPEGERLFAVFGARARCLRRAGAARACPHPRAGSGGSRRRSHAGPAGRAPACRLRGEARRHPRRPRGRPVEGRGVPGVRSPAHDADRGAQAGGVTG